MEPELIKKVDESCQTAEEFVRLYYRNIDKSRYQISRLYMDTATLVWNGNGVTGNDKVQKFLMDLPASEHNLNTLDAHPIVESPAAPQMNILVQAVGTVRYQDTEALKSFYQTFLITAVGDKWKIVSDCIRLQTVSDI